MRFSRTLVSTALAVLMLSSCGGANAPTTPAGASSTATVPTTATVSATTGQVAESDSTVEPATFALRLRGVNGFPQQDAIVLCDESDLRVSVCSDDNSLYVQAILWNDGDDQLGKTDDGRAIGDWSNLTIDADADQQDTPQVDRTYSLNPWPKSPGLHYQIALGNRGFTALQSDSAGRGAIEYFNDTDGKRTRVDSFLIPLAEIKRIAGDEIRMAYWGSSVTPNLTVNSVGFESPQMYYSHMLPRDQYNTVKLGGLAGQLDEELVPDPRGKKSAEPERVVKHPPLGAEPPEVVAADWLNTDDPQTLAALRGNVVLVEFWATWCGPCVAGIPHLNELHEKYRGAGLRILSFTDQDRETVEEFQKKAKAPIEYMIGLGSNLFEIYGVTGIPHAFLVGRDGKLRWHGHPAGSDCEVEITAALNANKPSAE